MNTWILLLTTSEGRCEEHRLPDGNYLVGSHPTCDVLLPGDDVAPHHALLVLSPLGVEVSVIATEEVSELDGLGFQGCLSVHPPAQFTFGSVHLRVERTPSSSISSSLSQDTRSSTPSPPLEKRATEKDNDLGCRTLRIELSPPKPVPLAASTSSEAPPSSAELPTETVAFGFTHSLLNETTEAPTAFSYTLQEEIARGGMAKIFTATDPLLDREVAVKVSSAFGEDSQKRFIAEAKILAKLPHPNIVPIHASGIDAQGFPFYSMKLVQGRTLQSVIRRLAQGDPETQQRFTRDRLLGIFRKVCDAIAFAHAKGIIHCDLKPENVMLGEFGEVLVLDWGLARPYATSPEPSTLPPALQTPLHDTPLVIEGTPQYMSPEQAQGHPLEPRSDIYSLGGILFAILHLHPPIQGKTLDEVLEKARKGIVDSRPALSKVANTKRTSRNGTSPTSTHVPHALQAVLSKAMAFKARQRYATVQQLSEDIEAYQNGFATGAEKASAARQILLLIRRHQLPAALLFFLLGSIGVFAVSLSASLQRAREKEAEATRNERFARQNAQQARINAQIAIENEKKALAESEEARRANAQAQLSLAEAAAQDLNAEKLATHLEAVPKEYRNQEWAYLDRLLHSAYRVINAPNNTSWKAWAPHPVKKDDLLTFDENGRIHSINLASGKIEHLRSVEHPEDHFDNVLGVSPDAQSIAVLRSLPVEKDQKSHGQTQRIEIYSLSDTKPPVLSQPFLRTARRVAQPAETNLLFNADGTILLKASGNGTSNVGTAAFDTATGNMLWERFHYIPHLSAFSPKTDSVRILDQFGNRHEIDTRTGKEISRTEKLLPFALPERLTSRTALSPEWGSLFILHKAHLNHFNLREKRRVFEAPLPTIDTDTLGTIAHYPSDNSIVSVIPKSQRSAVLQFWNSTTGAILAEFPLLMDYTRGRNWSLAIPSNSHFVAVIRCQTMLVWEPISKKIGRPLSLSQSLSEQNAFSFVASANQAVRLTSPSQSKTASSPQWISKLELYRITPPSNTPLDSLLVDFDSSSVLSSFSQDGRTALLLGNKDGTLFAQRFIVEEDHTLKLTQTFPIKAPQSNFPLAALPNNIRLNPQGTAVWIGPEILDARSGKRLAQLKRSNLSLDNAIAGEWVDATKAIELTLSFRGEPKKSAHLKQLILWDTTTGEYLAKDSAPDAIAIAVSPDGRHVAEAGSDMRVRIRNAQTLAIEQQILVHQGEVVAAAWHPHLPLLATTSSDRTVKVWDLRSNELSEQFGIYRIPPSALRWSPDGTHLAVQSDAGIFLLSPKASQKRTP